MESKDIYVIGKERIQVIKSHLIEKGYLEVLATSQALNGRKVFVNLDECYIIGKG